MSLPDIAPSTLLFAEPASVFDARQRARAGRLFAIIDACDAPAVPPKVADLGEERAISLYRGSAEEQFADIAPYLAAVDEDLLDWILTTLWAEPWGVLLTSDADLATLRTHFRKFLVVDAPTGEQWYFRYYDPRVLASYLPTCTEDELRRFFGPVLAFGTRDDAGVRWLRPSTPQEAWQLGHPAPPPKIVFVKPSSTTPRRDPAG